MGKMLSKIGIENRKPKFRVSSESEIQSQNPNSVENGSDTR